MMLLREVIHVPNMVLRAIKELLIWSDFEVNNGQLIMFYYYESIFIVFGLCSKLFELYDI